MEKVKSRVPYANSVEEFSRLIDEMLEGFVVHEIILDDHGNPTDYRFLAANPAFEKQTGLKIDDIRGKTAKEVLGDVEPEWIERYGRVALTSESESFTSPMLALGRIYEVHVWRPEPGLCATIFSDVTERESAVSALHSAMRALKTLSFASHILSRSSDEIVFLHDVCEMAVREGGYRMALVGYVHHDERKSIEPAAVFPEVPVLRSTISWGDGPEGEGVSGRAVRSGKPVIVRDTLVDPGYACLQTTAIEFGYRSVIGFPLIDPSDQVFAVFCVTSSEPDAFDPQEARLLGQLAKELSYGVWHLRGEARRAQAEEELRLGNLQLQKMVRDITESMGRIVELRDPYTQGHQRRVAQLAGEIAQQMGLSKDDVSEVELAGIVHDIGKLCVPSEILTKPGRLSAGEFGLIEEHPSAGFDVLKNIGFPWPVAEIVLQHHERMDGSGYPSGLTGEEIRGAARILAVADVVEAMASHRPYRPALGLDAAVSEIRSHPEKFDPDASRACMELYETGALTL